MTFHRIEHANIHWNEAGIPVSQDFDDVYFSPIFGLEETRYVFLQKNQLPTRWHSFEQDRFVIAETGFGTGLHFLAAWQCFAQFRAQNPQANVKQLHFISVEKNPFSLADLETAHARWPELALFAKALRKHFPLALPGCHRLIFAEGMITLDLWFGDIKETLPQIWTPNNGLVDAWFLDGFTSNAPPQTWEASLFKSMAHLSKNACTLSTFTGADFVRQGLKEAGFDVKNEKSVDIKRDMITGVLSSKTIAKDAYPWYKRTSPQNSDDIAIIGGGIASATLALSLTRRGKKVTLYCQDEKPGLGASGNRQGAVYPLLSCEDGTISRFFAPAFLFSRQFIDEAADANDFDHAWCGVTHLAWNEKTAKKLKNILDLGFPETLIKSLNVEQTAKLTQIETGFSANFVPLGGWLCPQVLTQVLIEKAVASGLLECHFNTSVSALTREDEHWKLHCEKKNHKHRVVILANGHQCINIEQTAPISAYPVRGQVTHIATTPELKKLNTVLCYEGYLTPANLKSDTHCIGASYNRNDFGQDFRMGDQRENKDRLVSCIEKDWTKEIDTEHTSARVGVRSASRDHLPFVGNVCDFDKLPLLYNQLSRKKGEIKDIPVHLDLYCILALGSRGLTSAPLLGELMASQVCGDPLPLPIDVLNALHPGRIQVRKQLKDK